MANTLALDAPSSPLYSAANALGSEKSCCSQPCLRSISASCSDFSIDVVPTRTGWPRCLQSSINDKIARYFSAAVRRSEEHTSELQSPCNLVCRLLLEKKKKKSYSKCFKSRTTEDRHSIGNNNRRALTSARHTTRRLHPHRSCATGHQCSSTTLAPYAL